MTCDRIASDWTFSTSVASSTWDVTAVIRAIEAYLGGRRNTIPTVERTSPAPTMSSGIAAMSNQFWRMAEFMECGQGFAAKVGLAWLGGYLGGWNGSEPS